jgi:single-strand DNA-binding protein
MSTYQKVIICGNLGQDPNTKIFDGGGQVSNFSVATTETWKDKQTSEKRERTEWHNIIVNGKLSEIADKYLNKGDKVLIDGSLRTRKWTDQNGVDKYTTEIVCRNITMISAKRNEREPESLTQNQPSQKPTNEHHPDSNDYSDPNDDDLPF